MQTIIQNSRSPAKIKGNRYYQTLTPKDSAEVIRLAHMGCIGDTIITKIQLEKGLEPTAYVEPKVTAHEVSGIFSALQGLRVEMRDKNSDLWSEIIANNKAMLIAYHNKEISSSIGVSADTIRKEIRDTLDGRETSLTQNLNGFQQRVQDAISKSTVTQLSTLYDRKFETVNGNVSSLTQTVNGFNQTVQSVNGQYSSLKQLVSGLQSTVGNSRTGLVSKVTQLENLLESKVDSNNFMTTIRQHADSIALALSGKVSGKMSGSEIISAINLTTGGVYIHSGDNKLVVTPQTVYIQNGTIKSAMIEELDGGKIRAGSIYSSHIASNAIEAKHISVDEALFNKLFANEAYLKTLFAKEAFITSVQSVTLSATQITSGILRALNRAMEIDLNNGQMLYYTDQAALKRVLSEYPTQFIKFASSNDGGRPSSVTLIGSNRDGTESHTNDSFSGIRIFNGQAVEAMQLISDNIEILTGLNNKRGWRIRTLTGPDNKQVSFEPTGDFTKAHIAATDFYIIRENGSRSPNLKNVLNAWNGYMSANGGPYWKEGF